MHFKNGLVDSSPLQTAFKNQVETLPNHPEQNQILWVAI